LLTFSETQKAFQAWLASKERERKTFIRSQKRIAHVVAAISPGGEMAVELPEEVSKKEQQWRDNFGMPAHVSPTFSSFKPVAPWSDDAEAKETRVKGEGAAGEEEQLQHAGQGDEKVSVKHRRMRLVNVS
jgi:polyhydroxyalkanoate synthesis regulator protein